MPTDTAANTPVNKEVKAHRAFYEAFEGPLPDGKYLQHHCLRIGASAMPAAIQTISSSTTRQGVRFQVERKAALKREGHLQGRGQLWSRNLLVVLSTGASGESKDDYATAGGADGVRDAVPHRAASALV